MASAASNSSSLINKPLCLKRNSEDVGWDYAELVDPNKLNVIKCKLCGLLVTAGIYRLKVHIAGIRGQEEDKARCKQVKRARLAEQQEVRDVVDLVGAPEVGEESENDD
ncbi:unnamed protein product [Urochloa humidicola]